VPLSAHSEQAHMSPTGGPRRQQIGMDQLLEAYLTAHETVIAAGFASEIDWQDGLSLEAISESEFMREAAWVILSAGMREAVVRDRFDRVASAFLQWESARAIVQFRRRCIRRALVAFRHPGKINAIGEVAHLVVELGFESMRERLRPDALNELQQLPFIGPVTCYHLAKNLGIDVVKPDRHLVRMARAAGFVDPESMCRLVAEATGDRLSKVDLVFWRFATIRSGYLDWFQPTGPHEGSG